MSEEDKGLLIELEAEQSIKPSASDSPPWSRITKAIVALVSLSIIVLVVVQFQSLIYQIIAAAILAYVLTPITNLIEKRTPLKQVPAAIIVYLGVAIIFILTLVGFGVGAYNQILNLIDTVPDLVTGIIGWLSDTKVISAGPFVLNLETIDWGALRSQFLGLIEPIVSGGTQMIIQLANSTVSLVTSVLFIFIVSIYMSFELPKLSGYIGNIAQQPGYRQDAERFMREFGRIWSSYLRGQIILGLVIGLAVWVSLTLIGVQNSFALGVLSGLLEFLPVIGPFVASVVAVIVGLFQPENYLGLSPAVFVLVIVVVMLIIQQIENNLLVPRIVGGALDLHPLIVIIAVFMGTSIAGIVGAILGAPVAATVKLVGRYAWRKMFDQDPFPVSEGDDGSRGSELSKRGRILRDPDKRKTDVTTLKE